MSDFGIMEFAKKFDRMAEKAIKTYVTERDTHRAFLSAEADKQRKWQQEENNKDRVSQGHFLPFDYKEGN